MISLVMKVFEIWMLVLTVTETVEFDQLFCFSNSV